MATLTADVLDSPAVAILCALEADGFRVELTADGMLCIAPRSRLTPERMQAIAACKDGIRLLLRCCDAGVQERRSVFVQQLAAMPALGVPAFLFRSGISYQASVCFSCGDALPEWRFGRCWRCGLAWRLAARVPIAADVRHAYDEALVCA